MPAALKKQSRHLPSEASPARPAAHDAAQRRFLILLAIGAVTTVLTVYGWRLLYFMTDDAYIAFRYASNSVLGRGLVWNPAPFRPVEGYTSFLWVEIVRWIWSLTGIEPPESANVLGLMCGLATLFIGARFVLRFTLPEKLERWRLPLLALVLVGTATNRTFLTWLSSGLETALFNLLVTWWLYEATARPERGRWTGCLRVALAASLCALCRPDGLLLVGATVVLIAMRWPDLRGRIAVAASPLLIVAAHLLWRHSFYGEWVPNTYYAKYSGAWPAAGIRYLACFVIEYGVWVWILLALAWALPRLRRGVGAALWAHRWFVIPLLAVLGQFGYYTFVIGGDHFEYRIYSHLILLLFVSGAWLASRVVSRGSVAALLVALFVAASWPVGWEHWRLARGRVTIPETYQLWIPVADHFPWPFRPILAEWDQWQGWLIHHAVCQRQEDHRGFLTYQRARFPTREEGARISWAGHPVMVASGVGIPGWVLPNVAIIDVLGLNDRVIARNAAHRSLGRRMAHDRLPPPGYVPCFRPDVVIQDGHATIRPRTAPLTDSDIRRCEDRDWDHVER